MRWMTRPRQAGQTELPEDSSCGIVTPSATELRERVARRRRRCFLLGLRQSLKCPPTGPLETCEYASESADSVRWRLVGWKRLKLEERHADGVGMAREFSEVANVRPLALLPSVALTECRVPSSSRKIDGCAVPTTQLSAVVLGWVKRWERDHPDLASSDSGRQGSRRNSMGHLRGNQAVAALTILEERTRLIDPEEVGIPRPTLESIVVGRWRTTELRTADMLVAAIEEPHVFHDGTLTVIPNPNASREARDACCGGSMNGSLAA